MSKSIATVVGWYGGYPVIEPINGWIPAVGTVLYSAPDPEQKPVVWIRHENEWVGLSPKEKLPIQTPRPDDRQPLTDDEIMLMANNTSGQHWGTEAHIVRLVRVVERAHGITND